MNIKKSPIFFNKNDIKIITRKKKYEGFFSIVSYFFIHRRFNGKMSKEIIREVFERGHAAVLLPYDPLLDKVILIEQVRIASFDSSSTPWLLEVIAGTIEHGETPEEVVRREAVEEANLKIKRIKPIMSYLASPGGTSERLYVLLGEIDSNLSKSSQYGVEKENEDIFVHVVSRKQAYQWIQEGIIDNAATILSLQWLELHYRTLLKEWNILK
ncbi:ADP-ribose diphosphatase [Pantoea sp. Aalb]|uniref:ADP-ribose diphosphatase n=1 Tax=Pantoea sp. Aalb TaxID=2576762 RepID=UPI00132AAC1B|nr:ADP-ribose diphosphatase [Pantoea sp. Aalb]MXP67707.1 ADP-ribose diphosphatase [Pantoea sp. Aalb]